MAAARPSEPQIQKLNIKKQSSPTVESAGFLAEVGGQTVIPAEDLLFSATSSPAERKKKFRLPKIVLQDKKTPDVDVKSCIEINSLITPNDAEIHEHDPIDPKEGKSSKYIVDRSDWAPLLKAEPGDLACFLAGCPPGIASCARHQRQRSPKMQDNAKSRPMKNDLQVVVQPSTRDGTRASQPFRFKSSMVDNGGNDGYATNSMTSPLETSSSALAGSARLRSESQSRLNGKTGPSNAGKSNQISEHESSVTSGSDAFPHAAKSLEITAEKLSPMSTSVVTNFSLRGVRSKSKNAADKEAARRQRSEAKSQGLVNMPEPLRIDRSRSWRTGSVACAREGIERRSRSEGPPSNSEPPLQDARPTGDEGTRNKHLPPSGVEPSRRIEDIIADRVEKYFRDPKKKLRSAKEDTRSSQPRGCLASKKAVSDDTTPTEVSDVNRGIRISEPAAVKSPVPLPSARPGRIDQMDTSSPSKAKQSSLLSSTGSIRSRNTVHDLLKPSVTESRPLDTGLPLPPVLSPVPAKSELANLDETNPVEAFKIISDRGKEKAIADRKDGQPSVVGSSGASGQDQAIDPPYSVSLLTGPPNDQEVLPSPPGDGAPIASQDIVYQKPQNTEESINAAYWGFVPVIKEAVQGIVEIAVRNAVTEVNIASAGRVSVASKPTGTYEPLKPNAELQRTPILVEPATSQRESEATVIRMPPLTFNPNAPEPIAQPAKDRSLQNSPRDSIVSKGQENEASTTRQPVVDSSSLYGELERVALDDSKSAAEGKQGWSVPTGWKNSGPAYQLIPDRRSSKKPRTTSSNKDAPLGELKISSKSSVAPQMSPSPNNIRETRALRSLSSGDSVDIASMVNAKDESKAPLIEQGDDGKESLLERISRANTVHWLRDLISTNEPYEPQFTTLPPHLRKDKNKAPVNPRPISDHPSETARTDAVKILPLAPVVAKANIAAAAKQNGKAEASEAFARTINDLELLMNEALMIARQVADTQDAPDVLGNAAKALRSDRDRSEEELRARYLLRKNRAERGSLPSVHESQVGMSDTDLSDMTEDNEFVPPRPPTPATVDRLDVDKKKSEFEKSKGRRSTPYPLPAPALKESPAGNLIETTEFMKTVDLPSNPIDVDGLSWENGDVLGAVKYTGAVEPTNPALLSTEDIVEPPPRFSNPDFTLSQGITFKTLSSGKSPRRLSPVKMDQGREENVTNEVSVLSDTGLRDKPRNVPLPYLTPLNMSAKKCEKGHLKNDHQALNQKPASKSVPNKCEVRDYIVEHRKPPIHERESSRNQRQDAEQVRGKPWTSGQTEKTGRSGMTGATYNWQNIDQTKIEPCSEYITRAPTIREEKGKSSYAQSFDGSNLSHELDFNAGFTVRKRGGPVGAEAVKTQNGYELRDIPPPNLPQTSKIGPRASHSFNLKGLNHLSLREHQLKGFSLTKTRKKQKIARDWSPGRKRFVASVSCLSTSLIGLLVGIYAGETPSIQYYIVDLHHYTVLGNVFFFIALAIPTFFFWPLPLLHGRKPYILGAMSLAMPLLFPQALAVGQVRSPYVSTWRVALILPRTAMGFCLGFANMNFKAQLTDVFGASLQSSNPHQEYADEFDVRRHGGGMGVWLGLWTWSALGSIGVGFMIGAFIINTLSPAYGFYISIVIIAFVMLLNVLVPETRRSAFRRSVGEVATPNGEVSRRLARGEIKMHMKKTGPKWWGEEFHAGVLLTLKMLRQPGFMVMALYVAWIYGMMVLIILLLGALMSRDYKFKSHYVAASATALPLGAVLAIPFQKASIFSRARSKSPISDDATLNHKKVHWSSHMVRRSIFVLLLPFAGLAFTLSSGGPPTPFILPILFAGLIGFLSNLAMAECHGILMETFDTSDLQPGMTGRSRGPAGDRKDAKRTNYSSFPRVSSAFAITQGFGYLTASAATGVGGALTRHVGAQAATGVMAGILLILSLMLLGVLVRFTTVQIVPDSRVAEMEMYHQARRASKVRAEEGIQEEEPFRPIIIGNPHHHTRRMCLLELGGMSRFSEIRIKNKLVDEQSLEAKHPNRAAMASFERRIKEKEEEFVGAVRRSLSRASSRGSELFGVGGSAQDQVDLGGLRDMAVSTGGGAGGEGAGTTSAVGSGLTRNRSGNGRGSRREKVGTDLQQSIISE